MLRTRGLSSVFRTTAPVLLIVAAGCGGSSDADDASAAGTTAVVATSTAVAATDAPAATDTTASTAPAATDAPADTTTSTTVWDGPPSETLLVPGDDGYFEALGAPVFTLTAVDDNMRIEGVASESVIVQQHETESRNYTTWAADGYFWIAENADALTPSLFPVDGVLGFAALDGGIVLPIDPAITALFVPGDEIDVDGAPGRVFTVQQDAALAILNEGDFPLQYQRFELTAVTNAAGALVSLEQRVDTLWTAPENMIDPPDPVSRVDVVSTIEITPGGPAPEFPTDLVVADADRIRSELLLASVTRSLNAIAFQEMTERGGDPSTIASPAVEVVRAQVEANPMPASVALPIGPIGSASMSTIGYGDGVFLVQAADGTWLCSSWLDPLDGTDPVTGSGASADEALADCAAQSPS